MFYLSTVLFQAEHCAQVAHVLSSHSIFSKLKFCTSMRFSSPHSCCMSRSPRPLAFTCLKHIWRREQNVTLFTIPLSPAFRHFTALSVPNIFFRILRSHVLSLRSMVKAKRATNSERAATKTREPHGNCKTTTWEANRNEMLFLAELRTEVGLALEFFECSYPGEVPRKSISGPSPQDKAQRKKKLRYSQHSAG
jgi:hypothetical protein